jgi:antitoxin Phd
MQDAKKWLSQLVNKALTEGPQIVTLRAEELVEIISKAEYDHLCKSHTSLLEFFRQSPLVGIELDLERDQSLPGF